MRDYQWLLCFLSGSRLEFFGCTSCATVVHVMRAGATLNLRLALRASSALALVVASSLDVAVGIVETRFLFELDIAVADVVDTILVKFVCMAQTFFTCLLLLGGLIRLP